MHSISELDAADPLKLKEALDLVSRVFWEFEAPEYSGEGVAEFMSYIEPAQVAARLRSGEECLLVCHRGSALAGVLAYRRVPPGRGHRAEAHISLLFVDKAHHRQGIAKALFGAMAQRVRAQKEARLFTVNSSPYAVPVYRRLGFKPAGAEQLTNGIRYTPMRAGRWAVWWRLGRG